MLEAHAADRRQRWAGHTLPGPLRAVSRRSLFRLAGLCLGVLAATAAFMAVAAPRARIAALREWRLRLTSVAVDRAAAIDLWLSHGLEEASLVASYPTVRFVVEGRTSGPRPFPVEEGPRAHLDDLLHEVVASGRYVTAAVIDAQGTVIAAWSGGPPLAARCIAAGVEAATTGRSGVAVCDNRPGQPLVLFVAPIMETDAHAVLATSPENWLYPFIEGEPLPTSTFETVLAIRDDNEAVFIAPLRHLPGPPLSVRRPLTMPGLATRAALEGILAVGRFVDYRLVPVIAATRPIPRSGWGLVVKVDEAEVLRPVQQKVTVEAAALAATLMAMGIAVLAVRRTVQARRVRERLAELEQRAALQRERDQALARLERQVQSLPIGLIVTEPDLAIVDVNPAAERIFGFAREELIGRSPVGLLIPESARSRMDDLLLRLNAADQTLDEVQQNLTKDGRTITCRWYTTTLRDVEGSLVGIMAMIQNISDRLRIEEALRASEERFRSAFESAAVGMALIACDGQILNVNRALCELLDRFPEALYGLDAAQLGHPEEARDERATRERLLAGEEVASYAERRFLRSDGATLWATVSDVLLRDQDGEPQFFVRHVQDMTDRKRAEAELAESERALATLLSNLPGMAYRCANRPEWPMELVSEGSVPLTGYAPSELQIGGEVAYGDLIVPEDRDLVWQGVQKAIAEARPFELNYRIMTRDGTVRWVWERGRAITDRHGQVQALEGFINEITERRAAEEALRRERDRAERYLDLAGVMFVALDREGTVTLVNPKACRVLGVEPDAILGRDWFAGFIPGPERRRVREAFRRIIAGELEPVEHFENRVVTAGGETRLIAWHNALLRDESGAIQGTLSSGEDVTVNRAAAEALRDLRVRLAEAEEAERRRLARELHDQVGQTLTALGINLSIVRQKISAASGGEVGQRLDDSRALVDEIVAQVRDVMADLRPSVLDDYGLAAALEWTAGRFQERARLTCEVSTSEGARRLPAPVETALFRIAQEALTNVVRHAGPCAVSIDLAVTRDLARLTVRDSGVGFDVRSMPLGRMGLAGMRERAEGIGGRLEVSAVPGEGVTIVAEVPLEGS